MGAVMTKEMFYPYETQPTKCFDCEKQLPPRIAFTGGVSKCYDCENQMGKMGIYPEMGGPTKCFSCEGQSPNVSMTEQRMNAPTRSVYLNSPVEPSVYAGYMDYGRGFTAGYGGFSSIPTPYNIGGISI